MRKKSSASSHLYYFPLSCVILDGATNLLTTIVDSFSQQDSTSSAATGNNQTFNDTSSNCSSPSLMTVDSSMTFTEYHDGRSFTVPCVYELRDRFQRFLKETSTRRADDYLIKLHKLMFLDEFYDPTRNRRKRIENCETLFRMCDQYLTLIHIQSKNSLSFSLLDTFPYLYNFEEMQKIQPDNSILKNHEYLVKWFRKQSENLKKYLAEKANQEVLNGGESTSPVSPEESTHDLNESMASPTLSGYINSPTKSIPGIEEKQAEQSKLADYLDENELKMLTYMLSSELEDYFSLFQKSNVKYMKKWLEKNVKSLPNYIIDTISKKRKKYLHYHENYKLREEDLNMKTILDSDFEFIQYLAEHTEDWTIMNSDSPIIQSFKSKENYSKIPDMKMQKFISKINYSIENVLKTTLCNTDEIGEKDNMIECSEYHHYTEIDPSVSSRKYSSVIQTSIMNYGSIFKKRSLENVISCRATFCGDEIQDAIHLYKTCSYVSNKNEDSKAPVKIVIVGGRIFSRIDSNRTKVIDVRMFNVGGMFFNSDFVVHKLSSKKMLDDTLEYLEKSMKKSEKEGFPMPQSDKHFIWKTFADYCKVHCKVNVELKWEKN
ncbi:predicted protein [Naegleria gruberi]|uniref:Predicted protein n=1 Tax=Naegleria gruberi TaxID=5762 RepID=D2V8I6_NAEGR|nr:uncharacterized protein NAEGRDRAFT_47530 [Naegleria gruberi]EFC46691.1 predicted protein [Naegleria gruberi]|eukprot:XP_002679435.1 predicted protein [Naegleria gruberi strain NEG-M]